MGKSATYDNPIRTTHTIAAHNFASGDATKRIKPPKGMRGKVVEIFSEATVTFTNVTTEAKVQVGVAGALTRCADFGLATLAAGTAETASHQDGALSEGVIADDEVALITLLAPTGGTPAGTGNIHVVMAWFN